MSRSVRFHVAHACPLRPIRCGAHGCGVTVAAGDADAHRHGPACPAHAELEVLAARGAAQREPVVCDACGTALLRRDLLAHRREECIWRLMPCLECSLSLPKLRMGDHRRFYCSTPHAVRLRLLPVAARSHQPYARPWAEAEEASSAAAAVAAVAAVAQKTLAVRTVPTAKAPAAAAAAAAITADDRAPSFSADDANGVKTVSEGSEPMQ
ncbi:unnamed protein product [Phaeothamnion confervicola]